MSVSIPISISLLLLPVVIAAAIWTLLRSDIAYDFDYHERFSFFAMHALYQRLLLVIVAVSTILILTTYPSPMLCAAIVYGVLFESWTIYSYERYLHSKYPLNLPADILRYKRAAEMSGVKCETKYVGPSSYTSLAYAITISLGLTTLIAFFAGLAKLAVAIELGGK